VRIAPALALLLVLLGAAPSPAHAPAGWEPDVRSARDYARSRAGEVSFAIRTERRLWGHRADRVAPSASVVKAMLLAAYLNRREVRDRPLRRADRRLLEPMVRRSDDVAASRVRDIVGNEALARLARRAHMTRFVAHPDWGRTQITARDQTKLFLRFDSFVPRRHRATAMTLLRTIVPSQRWGIALARPPRWELYFKGGWGSGRGAVDHQVALLRHGRERVALAILTTGNPSHAYAAETLRVVAVHLLRGLADQRRRARSTVPTMPPGRKRTNRM
jgi:Beta-lactamase enzyme family